MKILIKVNNKAFTGTLEDNATARAFQAVLPMTIQMAELNGNEKYFRLSTKLPTKESNPGTIQTGDVMLYGLNTLFSSIRPFLPPTTTHGPHASTILLVCLRRLVPET